MLDHMPSDSYIFYLLIHLDTIQALAYIEMCSILYHVHSNVWDSNGQGRTLGSEPLDGSVGTTASRTPIEHDVGRRVDDELGSSSKMLN